MHFPSRHPTSDPFPSQTPVEASNEAMDVNAHPHRRLSFHFRSLSKRHSSSFLSAILSPHPVPDHLPPLSPPHKHNVLHRKSSAPPLSREQAADEEERHRYRISASTTEGDHGDGGAPFRRSGSPPPPSSPLHSHRTRRFSLFRRSTSGKRPHLASGSEEGGSSPPPVPPLPTPSPHSYLSNPASLEPPCALDRATFSPTISPTTRPFSPKHSPPPSPPLTPPLSALPASSLPSSPVLHSHDLPTLPGDSPESLKEPFLHEEGVRVETPREWSETAEIGPLEEGTPFDSAKEHELAESGLLDFPDETASAEQKEVESPLKVGKVDTAQVMRVGNEDGRDKSDAFERFPFPPPSPYKPVEQDLPTPFPPPPSPSPAPSPSLPTQSSSPPRPKRRPPSPPRSLSPYPSPSPSPSPALHEPDLPAVLFESNSPPRAPISESHSTDFDSGSGLLPPSPPESTAQGEGDVLQAVEVLCQGDTEKRDEGIKASQSVTGAKAELETEVVEPETEEDVATPVAFEPAVLALPVDDGPPSAPPVSSSTPAPPLVDVLLTADPSSGLPAQITFPHLRARVVSLGKSRQDASDGTVEEKEAKVEAEEEEGEGLFVGENLQKQRAIAALVALLW